LLGAEALYGGPSVAAPMPTAGPSVAAPTTDEGRTLYGGPSVAAPVNAQARQILDLAAHCAPGAPIPLELLRRAATDYRPPTTDDDDSSIQNPKSKTQNLDAASHRLVTIGLASYGDEGQALSVHRLVAAFAIVFQKKNWTRPLGRPQARDPNGCP